MENDPSKYLEYRFPGQKEGEQIKALVRKHWIVAVKLGLVFAFLGLVPMIIGIIIAAYFWNGEFSDGFIISALSFLVYFLFICLITYIKWLNEELDIIIVTNERVVSHDQVDLFHRQISETNISQVQDVKGVQIGLLSNFLHFGQLEIQTAAKDIVFKINNVNMPYEKARIILDIRDKYLDKEKFEKPNQADTTYVYNI